MISQLALQQYWWIILSLLAGILVFLLFVQGGQTLIYTLGKTEKEHTLIINAIGRKWEFTFTVLVVFGAGFFASFPLFYSTSFGGAYWVWMAILLCFVLQAFAYESRNKAGNVYGPKTFETFLLINGIGATVLLGTAVATLFTGGNFIIRFDNIAADQNFTISRWTNAAHGLEAVLDLRNVALGLAVFFLARVLGVLYIANAVDNTEINSRIKKNLLVNAIPFVVFFLAFVISIMLSQGTAYDPQTKMAFIEKFKYFHNLIQMPLVAVLFVAGVLLVLGGIAVTLLKETDKGIWYAGTGTIVTVFAMFLLLGFNHTAIYPSLADLQSSITIENGSSSHYTLLTMSYVSLFVPVVIAYIFYTWRAINNNKMDSVEIESEHHVY
ncbi:MAG TPA: cytochrome d ubiquinol oxidase subunit II [Bacteroidales bacterium]|nr:cytochrome d ubiquinol oxidase subunit II [Bacteroidales bacterium]